MLKGEASNFAHLVAHYRQQRGMSQGQLAQATRLSRTYVYHLETGQRTHPSQQVAQNIARALELRREERQQLYEAYQDLTGQLIDIDLFESTLLDLGDLANLLVQKTSYPSHSLDRLWYLHAWNEAAVQLFETEAEMEKSERLHLLGLVFNPAMRRRFRGWEHLARRLVSDFMYNTRTITHLPEYKALWRSLRELSEFKRISTIVYPRSKPAPSFVFQVQHSRLGLITLRTATTVFTGINSYSMVSYVPGDQQTLDIYRRQGW
ncbi:MAG: helix-turn-helix domain-containing protein [Ktedonobacteraceae bacterium]|jgi:transcriptional regulator with XRE-family HTH domain|nr:helix-turn-helix domain-containing protein [Ktedonobacteraceae bacterium]MBO0792666.1 helix-turn-helix domain-containing protein [Ktedonobacteraceae bacterium]